MKNIKTTVVQCVPYRDPSAKGDLLWSLKRNTNINIALQRIRNLRNAQTVDVLSQKISYRKTAMETAMDTAQTFWRYHLNANSSDIPKEFIRRWLCPSQNALETIHLNLNVFRRRRKLT